MNVLLDLNSLPWESSYLAGMHLPQGFNCRDNTNAYTDSLKPIHAEKSCFVPTHQYITSWLFCFDALYWIRGAGQQLCVWMALSSVHIWAGGIASTASPARTMLPQYSFYRIYAHSSIAFLNKPSSNNNTSSQGVDPLVEEVLFYILALSYLKFFQLHYLYIWQIYILSGFDGRSLFFVLMRLILLEQIYLFTKYIYLYCFCFYWCSQYCIEYQKPS